MTVIDVVHGVGVGTRPPVAGSHAAFVSATVPAFDDTSTGTPSPVGVDLSCDDLAAAIASAMTLFGRVECRRTPKAPQFSNGRWVGP